MPSNGHGRICSVERDKHLYKWPLLHAGSQANANDWSQQMDFSSNLLQQAGTDTHTPTHTHTHAYVAYVCIRYCMKVWSGIFLLPANLADLASLLNRKLNRTHSFSCSGQSLFAIMPHAACNNLHRFPRTFFMAYVRTLTTHAHTHIQTHKSMFDFWSFRFQFFQVYWSNALVTHSWQQRQGHMLPQNGT